jgi:hypothetical protein
VLELAVDALAEAQQLPRKVIVCAPPGGHLDRLLVREVCVVVLALLDQEAHVLRQRLDRHVVLLAHSAEVLLNVRLPLLRLRELARHFAEAPVQPVDLRALRNDRAGVCLLELAEVEDHGAEVRNRRLLVLLHLQHLLLALARQLLRSLRLLELVQQHIALVLELYLPRRRLALKPRELSVVLPLLLCKLRFVRAPARMCIVIQRAMKGRSGPFKASAVRAYRRAAGVMRGLLQSHLRTAI